MDEPRELIVVDWPDCQAIMSHPAAALILSEEPETKFMVPKEVWEHYKNTGYDPEWVTVQIDITEEEKRDKIRGLREKLIDEGITFDTGSNGKTWDWELDWSLKGAEESTILLRLEEEEIPHTILSRHEAEKKRYGLA